jgi:aminoglycoside phosphotransferase (APT) family kinase protein
MWDADFKLSHEAADALIGRQFPDLLPVHLELLGEGWDNSVYRVNERFAFRFPRRKLAVSLLSNEMRAMPLIAPHVPLPVPEPTHVGSPAGDYPYPFAGYRFLPGETACRRCWTDDGRARTAPVIARFLAALHSIPIDQETRGWAPGDVLHRTDLTFRAAQLKERLRSLDWLVPMRDLPDLLALVDRLAETPPWSGPPVWVHGDLYARHLLVDEQGDVSGIIDWGDVHVGDPALDLSIAYSFLPPSAVPKFREAYGTIGDDTWERARFRAIHYGAILAAFGDDIGDTAICQAGEFALRSAGKPVLSLLPRAQP